MTCNTAGTSTPEAPASRAMTDSSTENTWPSEMFGRARSSWRVKMIGTTVSITVFMIIYFILMQHPQFPVTPVPATWLDRAIGFQPWGIVPYVSLWLYISLAPMLLLLRWREMAPYLSTVFLLSMAGFTIFFFWPTVVIQPDIEWSRYPFVALLKSVDASGNACPSMHVAFSVLTALWLHRALRLVGVPVTLHVVNIAWCLLILYSTMVIKQHLALDVVAGTALALIIVVPHLRFLAMPGTSAATARTSD